MTSSTVSTARVHLWCVNEWLPRGTWHNCCGGGPNSAIAVDELDRVAPLSVAARALLRRELEVGRLSGRGLHRVRRVARTIADLDAAPEVVGEAHVAAALRMRTNLAQLSGGPR